MRGETRKEVNLISWSFYEHVRTKSLLNVKMQRERMAGEVFASFRELRREQSLRTPSLSSLLYFMRQQGLVKRSHGGVIIHSLARGKKTETVIDSLAPERLNRSRRKASANNEVPANKPDLEIVPLPPAIMEKLSKKKTRFLQTIEDKTGVSSVEFKLSVTNKSPTTVVIKSCQILTNKKCFKVTSSKEPKSLSKDEKCTFTVTCVKVPQEVGVKSARIVFCFKTEDVASDVMSHVYYIEVEKVDEIVKSLKPKSTMQKPVGVARIPSGEIVPGQRPPPLEVDSLEKKVKIPPYHVQQNVKDALIAGAFTDDRSDKSFKNIRQLAEQELSASNYSKKFHLLLQLEELQSDFDILRYSMSNVSMKRQGDLMYLRVPGLAEKRPSVLRGDKIYVTFTTSTEDGKTGKQYQGYVHRVELEQIAVGFSPQLLRLHTKKSKYDVRFSFNRFPICLGHRALDLPLPDVVRFPQQCEVLHPDLSITAKQLKNELIQSNLEQMQAISNIVIGKTSPVPYIIFGPPGTGKTVTMVEAICQVIYVYEGCHILVCAPSNSACDHLAKLLSQYVRSNSIFRMHAASRSWIDVPKEIRTISNYINGEFYFPPKADLEQYEILICTLTTAGRIASAGFPDDYFTHVFVDEAGQATEPQCMTALAGVLSRDGQLVLAGDPKQLGPVVTSAVAKRYGLGVSYLERIMEKQSIYQKDEEAGAYNSRYITKLLKNYRSHRAILKVPNECFYDNELVYAVQMTETMEAICNWRHLPQTGFPVIFEGVEGQDLRESNSPSFFNPHEVSMLMHYVRETTLFGFTAKDIGIITPYRKQVEKIRQNIRQTVHNASEIKVGTVEEFQGQERNVIIISTVRSSSDFLSFDAKHNLGFLSDPKRFNVAITRAKMLLIVIGNPNILSLDYYWKSLLDYCVRKCAYRGIEYKEPEEQKAEMDDILKRMNELDIES